MTVQHSFSPSPAKALTPARLELSFPSVYQLSRTTMFVRKMTRAAVLSAVCALLLAGQAFATTVNFEGMTTGTSVNGQGGWTVEDEFGNSGELFDEEVVDLGGNNVWRLSNAIATGGFSNQSYSHTTTPAGESDSALWNDRGTDHTLPLSPPNPGTAVGSNLFHAGFRFKSATGAAQSDLSLSVSPSAKQSSFRNSFIGIADDGANGIDLSFFETGIASAPFGSTSNFPQIASDLSYSDWHTIDIFIEFLDGVNGDTTGNDKVHVFVNGSLAATGTTWESFYRGVNPAGLDPSDQPQRQAVDSLIFRSSSAALSNAGNGFYFDDVVIDNAAAPASAVPVPGAGIAGVGLVGLLAARRRRRA